VAYEQRGNLLINLGFAQAGWEDLHQAEMLAGTRMSYSLAAKLGEARRVYARDVLLNGPENVGIVYEAIRDSVKYFNYAEAAIKSEASRPDSPDLSPVLAWVYAHRAAAHTLAYWIESASGKPESKHFSYASDDFDEARKRCLKGDSADWIDRFQAFLYALRADKTRGDLQKAAWLLEKIKDATADSQVRSSIERSLAMLFSYEEGEENARASVDLALSVIGKDAEDYLASYFAAASVSWLAKYAEDRHRYQDHLEAAIQSARVRSSKVLSQAYATLASLSVLEAMSDSPQKSKAKREAKRILQKFHNGDPYPDLETWAILTHDCAWRELEKEVARDLRKSRGRELAGVELEQEARNELERKGGSQDIDRGLLEIYVDFRSLLGRLARNSRRACEGRSQEREVEAKTQ